MTCALYLFRCKIFFFYIFLLQYLGLYFENLFASVKRKKIKFSITKKKKKKDLQKAKKHRFAEPKKKKKNPNLHDTGGDLYNFCMTGPSGRDLYKTYPDLQGLGKKKEKKEKRSANTNCNFSA